MIVSAVHKCVLTQYSTWPAQVLLLSMQILSKENYGMLHPYHLLLIIQILTTMSHNNSPKVIQISSADHTLLWGILNVNLGNKNERIINIFGKFRISQFFSDSQVQILQHPILIPCCRLLVWFPDTVDAGILITVDISFIFLFFFHNKYKTLFH